MPFKAGLLVSRLSMHLKESRLVWFCLFYTCPTFLRSPYTIKNKEDDRVGDAGDGVYSGLDWVAGTVSCNPTR